MEIFNSIFEAGLRFCYTLLGNYGLAIILFTFLSKIVLLPLSVWVQKNSIKLVKMQPDINFLKAEHFGDGDAIAEGQAEIYKKEGYHPLASLVPLAVQIILLMGIIAAIRACINDSSINMGFLGVDMSLVPAEHGGLLVLSPIFAGLSAWIMCVAQNAANVLQAEQGNWNKYGMLALSVVLSLYLGWFVPVGVAVYWVTSNLLSIVLLYALNAAINPKDYVDYARLEESKKQLAALQSLGGEKKKLFGDAESRREKADYKRFFSIVNKHLVFYSESSGFYKYYRGMIEYILKNTNIVIHYITSDPNDIVFTLAESQPRLKPYFIREKKLITLMMKLDCDVMVMTMPDLENYHIKRSYVRKDIEYVYVQHGIGSVNLALRKGAQDHYDTVFCCGEHQKRETQQMEELDNTPPKKIFEWGYSLLDEMLRDYESMEKQEKDLKEVLVAPSWQKDNIVDSCLEIILDKLADKDYHVTVRPHPQHVWHKKAHFDRLKEKYADNEKITIQTDFSSDKTVFNADLLISDWSSIAYEFAYTTLKPVLFINTPMKIMNPDYDKIAEIPMDISVRNEIGCDLELDELDGIDTVIEKLLTSSELYRDKIICSRQERVYNLGSSSEAGAKYLISAIQKKIRERKEQT